MNNGEQVVAHHSLFDEFGIWNTHQRIDIPHDDRSHRRISIGQDFAETTHVEGPWTTTGKKIGTCKRCLVDDRSVPDADTARNSATAMLPSPDECWKACNGSEEHGSVLVVLSTNERAYDRRSDGCVVVSKSLDVVDAEPGDGSGPLRRMCSDV